MNVSISIIFQPLAPFRLRRGKTIQIGYKKREQFELSDWLAGVSHFKRFHVRLDRTYKKVSDPAMVMSGFQITPDVFYPVYTMSGTSGGFRTVSFLWQVP